MGGGSTGCPDVQVKFVHVYCTHVRVHSMASTPTAQHQDHATQRPPVVQQDNAGWVNTHVAGSQAVGTTDSNDLVRHRVINTASTPQYDSDSQVFCHSTKAAVQTCLSAALEGVEGVAARGTHLATCSVGGWASQVARRR